MPTASWTSNAPGSLACLQLSFIWIIFIQYPKLSYRRVIYFFSSLASRTSLQIFLSFQRIFPSCSNTVSFYRIITAWHGIVGIVSKYQNCAGSRGAVHDGGRGLPAGRRWPSAWVHPPLLHLQYHLLRRRDLPPPRLPPSQARGPLRLCLCFIPSRHCAPIIQSLCSICTPRIIYSHLIYCLFDPSRLVPAFPLQCVAFVSFYDVVFRSQHFVLHFLYFLSIHTC